MAGLKKRGPASRQPRKRRREGPCSFPDKKKFPTHGQAEHTLLVMQWKGKVDIDVHVYPCGSHWHLGHSRRLTNLLDRLRQGRVA